MAIYLVQNQWGGSSAPWNPGGTWVMGCRSNQPVVAVDITSTDAGKTFKGTMTYEGEGQIGLKATQIAGNNYVVENQWGGTSAPWHPGGNWIIGYRVDQRVVQMKVQAVKGGANLEGTITYEGEGPIGCKCAVTAGCSYTVLNQWGGAVAPWHPGGTFVLGAREDQCPVAYDINSNDGGKTFTGTMTYQGEGPIGFRAKHLACNVYTVENQWGGTKAPWQPGGQLVIGARINQNVVNMRVTSMDNGGTFSGEMTYAGEGPIGVQGILTENVVSGVGT